MPDFIPTEVTVLYRYEDCPMFGYNDGEGATIFLRRFFVQKETRCGYWYAAFHNAPKTLWRWVSKDAYRRRCYQTKAAAWNSFIVRKTRQKQHLEEQLERLKHIRRYINANPDAPEDSGDTTSGVAGPCRPLF